MRKAHTSQADQAFELPYDFSAFVLQNPLGASQNLLGLMSHQSFLARQLLPQFTVLSSQPRYHSILCGFLWLLHEMGLPVSPAKVRECEILWGLSQARLIKTQPELGGGVPLNIRRFNRILEELEDNKSRVTLDFTLRRKFGLMDRLNYGVWGFYINPSKEWGLVDESLKRLKPLGVDLGSAFVAETDCLPMFKRWLRNRAVTYKELESFGRASAIKLARGPKEQSAWSRVLTVYKESLKKVQPAKVAIWDALPNVGLDYQDESLKTVLTAQSQFEAAAAWTEFVFEVSYLKADSVDGAQLRESDTRFIFEECQKALKSYFSGVGMFGKRPLLFQSALEASNYRELEQKVRDAHNEIQRAKNKSPYLSREGKIIQNGLNCDRAYHVLTELGEKPMDECVKDLAAAYQRDWHFAKAARYKESFQ